MEFVSACERGDIKEVEQILNPKLDKHIKTGKNSKFKIDIHYKKELGFRMARKNGHIKIVRLLMNPKLKIDIHAENEGGFAEAYMTGNVELVKLFLSNPNSFPKIKTIEHAFRIVCQYSYTELVRFLLNSELKINIHVDNEYGFAEACYKKNIKIVEMLLKAECDYSATKGGKKHILYLNPDDANDGSTLLMQIYEKEIGITVPNLELYRKIVKTELNPFIIPDLIKIIIDY